jgi:hypothetical protein
LLNFIRRSATQGFSSSSADADLEGLPFDRQYLPDPLRNPMLQFLSQGSPPVPLEQTAPYPPRADPPRKVDPRTPGLGQPMPGVLPTDYRTGNRVTAVGDVAGLINEVGRFNTFLRRSRIYRHFIEAGGPDAVERVETPGATPVNPQPKVLYDARGNLGIRMNNGDEFWRFRLRAEPNPPGFNVQMRTIDGRRVYRVNGGDWTYNLPKTYNRDDAPRWIRWALPE